MVKQNVLKGIDLDKDISENEALIKYNQIENIDDYIKGMGPNDYWDNKPFEIHRVFY